MVELAISLVEPRAARPRATVLCLHGILGSRSNFRSLARRLVEARPEWSVILADLRKHGDSQDAPPPHTLEAAARDLIELAQKSPTPVRAVLGHSFGGKVGLQLAASCELPLTSCVAVDAMPGPRPDARGSESTLEVVGMLRALPQSWPSRDAFVARVVELRHDEGFARWLAMNLEPEGDAYALRLDLDAIEALLADYFARDLWPVVEAPPKGLRLDLVVGGASPVFAPEDIDRARRAAANDPRVHVHVIDGASHWVHVDAPDALLAIWADALGEAS